MRTIKRILVLFALCVSFAAVACFAGGVESSSSFNASGDPPESDVFYDVTSSDGFLQGVRLETGSADEMEDLRLAQSEKSPDAGGDLEDFEEEEEVVQIADPMEPVNRAIFHFNDKLYFWFLKPVATGYKWVVPEILRIAVRNFFTNVAMPVRVVNCLLQGKFESSFNEVGRFLINSTAGMGGLVDVAKEIPELPSMQEEDLDQTLGVWGLGQGFFINVPVFGPSSVRGAFGQAGDYFLDPASYLDSAERIAVGAGDAVNRTSLTIGDYESLKEAALDPYIALRDAYVQNRKKKIAE